MKFSNWKDIAELFALVAVIASLIAVVFELRQTQTALQAQAYQSRAFQSFDHHMDMLDRPNIDALFNESWRPGFQIESLDSRGRTQLTRIYHALRTDYDNEHYQYQHGFLDEDFYFSTTINDIKTFAPVWRTLGVDEARSEFREEVDRILADSSIIGWTPAVEEKEEDAQE